MTEFDRVYRSCVRERFPLPSPSELSALEARIKVQLPRDYRQFLLEYNGGWFGEHDLALPEDAPGDRIDCLYGIGADHESAELGKPSDMSLFDDNDPPQLLVIGHTAIGQLIVLDLAPETSGEIYLKSYLSRISKTDQLWFWLADSIEGFFELIGESTGEE